jgi:hypothetical protein
MGKEQQHDMIDPNKQPQGRSKLHFYFREERATWSRALSDLKIAAKTMNNIQYVTLGMAD